MFGPVLPIQPFDEVVNLVNDSRYGLAAYVEQLQGFRAGYRLSGVGGDDGPYGHERYLRRKIGYLHYDDFGTPAELNP